MLNKKEKQVMWYLFEKCKDKDSALVAPQEIANNLMPRFEINIVEIDQIINALMLDNYIDVVHSDSKGKLIYVVSLKPKGASFERMVKHNRKKIYVYVIRTVALACLSFIVGLILKSIF